MGAVENSADTVEGDPDPAAAAFADFGPEASEKRFNVVPRDVTAFRLGEDRLQSAALLLVHPINDTRFQYHVKETFGPGTPKGGLPKASAQDKKNHKLYHSYLAEARRILTSLTGLVDLIPSQRFIQKKSWRPFVRVLGYP
jgi:hypothetical protein